jgi:hypothetical protein
LPGSHWGLAAWDLTTGRYRGRIVGEHPAGGFALDAAHHTLWVARGRRVDGFDTKSGAALFDPKRRKPISSFVATTRGELLGVAVAEGDGPLLFWGDRSWGISRDRKTVATTKAEPAASGGFVGAFAYVVFEHRVAIVDPLTAKVLAEAKPRGSAWLSCGTSNRIFVTTDAALDVFSWNGRKLELENEIAGADIRGVGCTPDGSKAAIAIAEDTKTVIRLVTLGRGAAMLSKAPAAAPKRIPRKRKLSKNEPLWGVPQEKWLPKNHVDFREYVANEHLVDGMPIVELHRNHDIPLGRVRRWIELYREGGRRALEASLARP